MILVVAAALLVPQEDVENRDYKRWSAFRLGAEVRMKVTVEEVGEKLDLKAGKRGVVPEEPRTREFDAAAKLTEVSGDRVVIEDNVKAGGAASPRVIPARVERERAVSTRTEGVEELEVGLQKIRCTWVETTDVQPTMKVVEKVWTSPLVPGGIVRRVHKSTSAAKVTLGNSSASLKRTITTTLTVTGWTNGPERK
jgi:hypothetical protein